MHCWYWNHIQVERQNCRGLSLIWTIYLLYLFKRLNFDLLYAISFLSFSQGMFIFIYHCLGNERIKKEMAKFLLRQPCLPDCLRVRLEVVARVGSNVYSLTQSSTVSVRSRLDNIFQIIPHQIILFPLL